jgi:hypothetical protein
LSGSFESVAGATLGDHWAITRRQRARAVKRLGGAVNSAGGGGMGQLAALSRVARPPQMRENASKRPDFLLFRPTFVTPYFSRDTAKMQA